MSNRKKQALELSVRGVLGERTYAGREGDPRETPIDYGNFPRGLSYVSVGDVDAAYKQGRADEANAAAQKLAEQGETVRRLIEQVSDLRAELAAPIAAIAMSGEVEQELVTSAATNGRTSSWDKD